MTLPKSASEVAEQEVTFDEVIKDVFVIYVYGREVDTRTSKEFAADEVAKLRKQIAALLDSYATERISADRRERERWIDAKENPKADGHYVVIHQWHEDDQHFTARDECLFTAEHGWEHGGDTITHYLATPLPPLPGPADAKENTQ